MARASARLLQSALLVTHELFRSMLWIRYHRSETDCQCMPLCSLKIVRQLYPRVVISEHCGTCAGEDDVADAGQAAEGERVRAQRDRQAHDLAVPARDQRRAPVAAEVEAVHHAAADGQHVLQRARQLHAWQGLGFRA